MLSEERETTSSLRPFHKAKMIDSIRTFFSRHDIKPCPVVLALSGGPDSTAALLLLRELSVDGFTLTAAHINHRLRGTESEEDEQFVRILCQQYSVPLEVEPGPLAPELVKHAGIEAAARKQRYLLLETMRLRAGAQYIITAHHKNDLAETVLIRLLTTHPPASLRGIREVSFGRVLRPFLTIEREQLETLVKAAGIDPRRDSMNLDPRFLRARVRSELIPLLRSFNPRIIDTLASLAEASAREQELLDGMVKSASSQSVERLPDRSVFNVDALPSSNYLSRAILLREIRRLDPECREISSADLERIEKDLPSLKRLSVSRDLELVRERDRVVLRRRPGGPPDTFELTILPGSFVTLPDSDQDFVLSGPQPFPDRLSDHDRMTQAFQLPDPPPVEPRFVIRGPARGDRFRPLGAPYEKKLAEFLIDRKIPLNRRASLPLLLCEGKIVWIPGVEVSEEFKVRDDSTFIYQATIRNRMSAPNPTFTQSQIAERVAQLGQAIRADAGDREILLIGILKGSSVFLADLLRATPGLVGYQFVDVVRQSGGEEVTDINFLTHFEMSGKTVYLLKDVVATGVIENYLLNQFRARRPAALKLVALLDRPNARRVMQDVDFSAFRVEGGIFVGYGLEHQGQHENLPYIARL